MPEIAERPPRKATLTRPQQRKIDWKLAAQLRATGLTHQQIAERTGAVSSEAVRVGLMRRGVNIAVRTALLTSADQQVKQSLIKLSEETKQSLAKTVLTHTQALSNVPAKANLNHIKRLGQAMEPLARTAKIVHGWGESSNKPLINLQVLGSVNFDTLPEQDGPAQVTDIQPSQKPDNPS